MSPPTKRTSLATPDDLADMITEAVSSHRQGVDRPVTVSDETIGEVIRVLYATSLLTEEGRVPDFTLLLSLIDNYPFEDMHPLRPPMLMTRDNVLRVWPAVPSYPCVLTAYEEHGTPFLRSIDPLFADHLLMIMGAALLITVRGPGELIAIYTGRPKIIALQGGELRTLKPLSSGIVSTEAQAAFRFDRELGGAFWVPTLQRMISLRHGGAIVLLPDDDQGPTVCGSKLAITHSIGPYENPWQFESGGMRRIGNARSAIVARMTSVDGCVVLSHTFRVLGFGAKLRVDVADLPDCVDANGGVSPIDLAQRGMRHRSAARFAFDVPRSTVAVLSQDGGVHVFRKHETRELLVVYGPFGDVPLLSPPLNPF